MALGSGKGGGGLNRVVRHRRRRHKPSGTASSTVPAPSGNTTRQVRITPKQSRKAGREARRVQRRAAASAQSASVQSVLAKVNKPPKVVPTVVASRKQQRAFQKQFPANRHSISDIPGQLQQAAAGAIEFAGGDPADLGLKGGSAYVHSYVNRTNPSLKDAATAAAIIGGPEAIGVAARGAGKLLKVVRAGQTLEKDAARAAAIAREPKPEPRVKGTKARASRTQTRASRAVEKPAERPKAVAKATGRKLVKSGRKITSPRGKVTRGGIGAAAVAPPAHGHGPAQVAEAFVQGHVHAIEDNPKKTLETTARALPAMVTFPASVAYETGKAATTGDTSGLQKLGEETKQFATHTGGELVSGDPKQVQKAVENDVGLSLLLATPRVAEGKLGTAVRATTRTKLAKATEKLPRALQVSPEKPRAIRVRVAKTARRSHHPAEYEAAHHAKKVVRHARKVKPREGHVAAGDAIHLVAKYGVSRKNPDHVLSLIRGKIKPAEHKAGVVRASEALTYLEKHPEVLRDKSFWRAVDAAKQAGEKSLTSKRAKLMGIGDLHGIRRPEARNPVAARELTAAPDREGAYADIRDRERTVTTLRRSAREHAIRGKTAESKAAYQRAREVQAGARELKKALHPYTRPGQSLDRTKRLRYDKQSLAEYENEVRAAMRAHGHEEPAHLPQVAIGHIGAGEVSKSFASGAKAPHVAALDELAADHIDNSLRSLVAGGIQKPRIAKGWHTFLQKFVASEGRKIGGKNAITRAEWENAIAKHEINPNFYVLLPSRDYFQAAKDAFANEEFRNPGAVADDIKARIDAINKEHRALEDAPGTKYVVVHRQAAEELRAMLSGPGMLERVLNANSKLWNRVLLGTSPGWELSQIVAEAIPPLVAHPEIVAKAPKITYSLNKMGKDEARGWASLAGEAPRVIDQPEQLRPMLPEEANRDVGAFVKATSRNPVLRAMWSTARLRPLGIFDRWRTGKYRSVLAAAELERDLNGFVRGLRGSLHFSKQTAAKLKGLPLHEQMAWLAKHPSEATKLQNYVDDIMGNWDAFTRFEREFAPALIFYPFVRYSLRWTFWSFPARHPIKAQMLYFLGQMNSDELEKLLGAKPANWTDYANPVIYGQGGGVLPFGKRIAPGLSAPVEALGGNKPAALISSLNPSLGLPLIAATGINPLSGEQESNRGLMALNQLLSMPAPARYFGLKAGGQSEISKEFLRIDPNRTTRSVLLPYLPLSGDRARLQNNLERALNEASQKPEYGDFFAAYLAHDRARVHALVKQMKLSQEASDTLNTIIPPQPGEDKAGEKAGATYNRIIFGNNDKKRSSSSGGLSGGGLSGGGLSGGGL